MFTRSEQEKRQRGVHGKAITPACGYVSPPLLFPILENFFIDIFEIMNNSEEAVDQFIQAMFGNLKHSPGYIDVLFDSPLATLDEGVLWSTFHTVCTREIFKRSSGDLTPYSDYNQAIMLQTAIAQAWPITYYLDMLVQAGIVHKFETDPEDITYAVKEDYIPVLNAILTEVDIKEGS